MASLWTPPTARKKVLVCSVCGNHWPMSQKHQWIRHVKACSKKNEDVLQELQALRESSIFTSIWDKELFDWKRERYASGKRDKETTNLTPS